MGRFIAHIDPRRCEIHEYLTAIGDEDFFIRSGFFRKPIRLLLGRRAMPWYGLSDLTAEMRLLQPLARRAIDVIHYVDGEHTARFLPRLPAPAGIPPVLATYHQPAGRLGALVSRRVVERLDHVVAVAPQQADFFSHWISSTRISVIPHGVEIDFFKPPSSRICNGQFRCITVGHHLRDFSMLRAIADSLRSSPHVRFDVVSSAVTGLEGLPNVVVHRGLSDSALLRMYQQADVLLLPLLDATANNTLLEGLACGLPAIVTDLPGIGFYAPGEEAMRLRAGAHGSWVDAIEQLRSDDSLKHSMGVAARSRAERLGWSSVSAQYENLYRELGQA